MILQQKKKVTSIFVLVVFIICFIGVVDISAQSTAEPDFKPVADEMIGSSGITWVPKMNYSRLELTLSRPDGSFFQKSFDAGSTPYLSLSSILGDSNMDGSYTYELRVIPHTERLVRDAAFKERIQKGHKALTQAGYFTVRDGAIVTGNETEPQIGPISKAREGLSGTQDQVILDDLIVDGSACIGFDCVNGESFGFDTLRLKENNLRIKFQDTSNTAAFPSNDWQITVNDSSSGGANRFSIDDIDGGRTPFTIEASAPSHSLYVDDGGRVGFGTSVPVADLHVKSGNTPTLRLEQDGSSGFSPQTWDVAGNEANFFIRDATNGSTLPFRIRPGAPSSAIDVAGSGRVGIGTESPSQPLHLKTTSTDAVFIAERNGGATAQIAARSDKSMMGSRSAHRLNFSVGNVPKMILGTNGYLHIGGTDAEPTYPIEVETANNVRLETSGNWVNPSSRELKENIEDLTTDEAMVTLNGLNPVKYNYKVDKTEGYVGFIAEDVPELVATRDRKGTVTMDIVAVLTKVVQEQQKLVQEQQKTISQLKKEIAEIKKKLK